MDRDDFNNIVGRGTLLNLYSDFGFSWGRSVFLTKTSNYSIFIPYFYCIADLTFYGMTKMVKKRSHVTFQKRKASNYKYYLIKKRHPTLSARHDVFEYLRRIFWAKKYQGEKIITSRFIAD